MLTVTQYELLYPQTNVGHGFSDFYPGIKPICEGMLQFTDETAICWGGPYKGNYAYFRLEDYTNAIMSFGKDKGKHLLTLWEAGKLKQEKEYNDQIKKETGEYRIFSFTQIYDRPSLNRPIRLYMAGNDDTSYSKFYTSEEVAKDELDLFIGNQPLDFHDVVQDFEFVFTN